MSDIITAENFSAHVNVSRETIEKLQAYASLLKTWQKRINLISNTTLDALWHRHFFDSAQLGSFIESQQKTVIDLGSGAGFPGMILAILGYGPVHLIESDARKCAFLHEVSRLTATPVTIHNARIEAVTAFPADLITSRALAPVGTLLTYAEKFLAPHSVCLFLKGKQNQDELTMAQKHWTMKIQTAPSQTSRDGTILILSAITRI